MAFVNLSGVSVAFGNRDVLDKVNINISEDSRIALAGANGSGKSTLLKIAAGLSKADSGTVSRQKGSRVSYLPQSGIVFSGVPLISEAEKAFSCFEEMIERMHVIEKELTGTTGASSKETALSRLLEEHHNIHESILSSGYYEREKEIDRILTGLGFSRGDFDKMTEEFSGGWQMRIALARTLLEKPDIMLLDEPTNYLDIEARQWLEEFISRFAGGVIIVSHDRFFLDVTCSEVIELFAGKLNRYKGNYSSYEKTRRQELESLVSRYDRQQEEIERIEYFIRKFRSNASKASLVQSRIKQLENIERIEIPESLKKIHFHFPSPPHSGKDVISIESLDKYYGSYHALKDINLSITRGEKIALAGKNGAGKSTLLRILSGSDSLFSGTYRLGKDVKCGYFSQDFEATLTGENTIIEEIESISPTELIPLLRNLLGAFLFRGDDIFKKISYLSGGEKNRIALLKLLLHPVNLLVLDEPTNHLDLNSKDILLDALKSYTGTLIFVSHDRYFIENLATRVIELDEGSAKDYPGDYEYYIWSKEKTENLMSGSGGSGRQEKESRPEAAQGRAISNREKDKTVKREKRKLEKRADEVMALIDKLEKEASDFENKMGLPEYYSDGLKIKELKILLDESKKKQIDLMSEWESIEMEMKEYLN